MSQLPVIECDDLVSCPRCGGEAIIQQRWVKGHANLKHYKPICNSCKFNYHDEYNSIKKAISVWNSSNVNNTDIKMYKSMSKNELIELIINNELIPIDQVTRNNKTILNHLKNDGYTIVSMNYLEQCKQESCELARYKFMEYEKQKPLYRYDLWEEDI